ncbi:MAG: alpha/beta fold hydrolase [Croceitalea sp.]|nr:alpha/beta fold hydrolase [Croceitalea sp.]
MKTASLSLEHLVRPPLTDIENAPALFMFHGYGSNEDDLFSFAPELPQEFFIISVRAPHTLEPFGYAWYTINFDAQYGKWSDDEQAIESREKIRAFIEEACEAYPIDSNKITLLGFSQGTILSYAVALSYPERIKNVIALSGYINENILINGYAKNDFKNLNVYASHGQVDQVIPIEWAQKTPEFLNKLGIEHMYEEFPVGHGVAPANFYSFKNWLIDKI